jgi:uncharacterized membrane protein
VQSLLATLSAHLGRHHRFYLSAILGVLVWAVLRLSGTGLPSFVVAGDVFFATYLAGTAIVVTGAPDAVRRAAHSDDEGVLLIVVLTLAATLSSFVAILALVREPGAVPPLHLVLALANVLLGWTTLHTIAGLHYAHAYYDRPRGGPDHAGGLAFPGTEQPDIGDFLYYAFTIGMAAQTADVSITSSAMRRRTLVHAVIAFFYNALIIALVVNVAAATAH